MEKITLPDVDVRVIVGREITAGGRTIWPVTRITVIKASGKSILAFEASPIAMLIIDRQGPYACPYAISISGKPMAVKEILVLAPALRDVLAKRGDAGEETGTD
ncbi:MAG: hypothetical protein A4E49_02239 [Methanosaeta sp. PtaU1.Bin112]|nr:MAG: hypothetical protein A4E49_02239 [Methanosaeta sp. PtaU1.Bin112]